MKVTFTYSANIELENVFVPDNNRLEKAKDFVTGTNKILEASRVKVTWAAVGAAAGAYETTLRYCL